MSNHYGHPIVTSGLVLCLDAGNTKSYPGTGTTWSDLSGQGHDGTIYGATYSSGKFLFDGTDYVSGSGLDFAGSAFTISLWLTKPDATADRQCFSLGSSSGVGTALHLRFTTAGQIRFDLYSSALDVTLPAVPGTMTNVTFTLASSMLKTIYQNGDYVGSNTGAVMYTGNSSWNIGRWIATSGEYFNQPISIVTAYNRDLTAAEVLQNYNAIKGRYGL